MMFVGRLAASAVTRGLKSMTMAAAGGAGLRTLTSATAAKVAAACRPMSAALMLTSSSSRLHRGFSSSAELQGAGSSSPASSAFFPHPSSKLGGRPSVAAAAAAQGAAVQGSGYEVVPFEEFKDLPRRQLYIIGRLPFDPEIKQLPSGSQICEFKVCVDKKDAERNSDWFVCKVWNEDLMDVVHGSFRKGQHVAVSGRLKARKYASRQGGDRMALDVYVDAVALVKEDTLPDRRSRAYGADEE